MKKIISLVLGLLLGGTLLAATRIPYKVADNYFVNNNVQQPPVKITSQKVFDQFFGEATTMGPNGNPTSIDFSKEFVISVCKPETDIATQLQAAKLSKSKAGSLTFYYRQRVGKKQTYTTRPCLLIIVKKKYDGKVAVRRMGK